jgi:hypothetical protein
VKCVLLFILCVVCTSRRLWRNWTIASAAATATVAATDAAVVTAASVVPRYDPASLMVQEFTRQGVPTSHWRLSFANKDYRMCDTYPSVLCVPVGFKDDHMTAAAEFRSKGVPVHTMIVVVANSGYCDVWPIPGRLPVLTWRHPANHAAITRCSQPLVGLIGHRNSADEELLEAIRCGPFPWLLVR